MFKIMLMMIFSAQIFADDIEDVKDAIRSNWESVSEGKAVSAHPKGSWIATSEGGFWSFDSPEDNRNRIEKSSNTLKFKPNHINVEIYGSKKDLAYAIYYLSGTIERDEKVIVANYRTRASNLLKKEKGKWLMVGAHYSPMHSGSGVKFD